MYSNLALSLFLVSILPYIYCDGTNSVQYTTQEFTDNINLKNHFVMFYAPWCSHCQRLHPVWNQLAELLTEEESRVKIAQVDCTKESSLCTQQEITGYPTLKYFSTENLEPVKYKGVHELSHLTMFLNVQMGSTLGTGENEHTQEMEKELNDDNYISVLSEGNHFVKFFAPWCGHCQRLAPTWEELGKDYTKNKHVKINKIDCTVNKDACRNYGIKSYPTLLWIENGQQVEKYQGKRSIDDFKDYIDQRLDHLNSLEGKTDYEENSEPESPVLTLTTSNFKSTVSQGLTFVKFFAPWCGHCKGLAPTWEDLGNKFASHGSIVIAKVDCTSPANKDVCSEEDVNGFPTILLYKDGKKIEEYTGSRSLEDMYEFVIKHYGEHDEL